VVQLRLSSQLARLQNARLLADGSLVSRGVAGTRAHRFELIYPCPKRLSSFSGDIEAAGMTAANNWGAAFTTVYGPPGA
jgi:hypothetical protein